MPSSTVIPDPRHWVQRHADPLYAYALARLDDEDLARDLIQETFLSALEQLGKFEGRSTERTWLIAILKYKIIAIYRKRNSALSSPHSFENTEPELEFFESDNGHWKEVYAPRPMQSGNTDPILDKELATIIKRCMQKLPGLWRSVFTMKHIDDEETETICAGLKITPSNLWVIIHRAKLNLRACIQKSW